jgi:protein-L-isoaspartate(D-aspartate) O-methyltransferase
MRFPAMPDFASARARMVERQIAARGIADPLILDAFRAVPRELFVGAADAPFAYDDGPLPIAAQQTISQPYIVALMIQAAGVQPGSRVLEIGAGSGYAAAVIGRIAGSVVALERHEELTRLAADRMERLGYANVRIVHGDGARGFSEAAPYDAIIVSAAAAEVPEPLLDQLASGGALVIPIGAAEEVQELIRFTRTAAGVEREQLGPVRFVPLLGGTTRDTGDEGSHC